MWGQIDQLVSRTLFLSICSGLDPDDTNPVFSPLLYAQNYSHQGVTSNGSSTQWEKHTINLLNSDGHQGWWHADNPSAPLQPPRPVPSSSAARAHAGDGRWRKVRDYLANAGVHKDVGGNKQADVSNEVGGFEHSGDLGYTIRRINDRPAIRSHTDEGDYKINEKTVN